MASYVERLTENGNATPPTWLPKNVHLEVLMGSQAYGVATESSDIDVYGFCIPPRRFLFPHEAGLIHGFDKPESFDQYQQHHCYLNGNVNKQYGFAIYNITRYFRLCADGNPNMIDSLFVSSECVLFSTMVGDRVRENRHLFLSKKLFPRLKGYAVSQLHKMNNKRGTGKRQEDVEKYGYSLKFAYHLIRLLDQADQLLRYGDLDLRRNREELKAIRRGSFTAEEIREKADRRINALEDMYMRDEIPVPDKPDEDAIRNLLYECLEMHYGKLPQPKANKYKVAVMKIQKALEEIDG